MIPGPDGNAQTFLYQALLEAGHPRLADIASWGPSMYWTRLDSPPTLAEVAAARRAFDLWFHQHPEDMDEEMLGPDRLTVEQWHASIHEAFTSGD